ncbi:hypothetical protein LTR49_020189 [Elasticomyces elasticus]|nr:hypothetical protein LTR49_020189 [Elasticomyces elasticus]KAK5750702.1 hypothetical protein LTS12_019233 [Elasticomyces elasticus]
MALSPKCVFVNSTSPNGCQLRTQVKYLLSLSYLSLHHLSQHCFDIQKQTPLQRTQQHQIKPIKTRLDLSTFDPTHYGHSETSNMPRSSIDKTFAAAPVSPAFNQPNSADFLPKYEETLNHNLRDFGDPEAQNGPVDSTQEPLKYGLTKKRRAIVVGSLIALVLIMGAVLVGVLSTKLTAGKQQVSAFSSTMFTTMIIAKPTLQTPLSTRATELQSQATSAEVTTSSSHFTDTAVPTPSVISATTLVYVTVTAKPQTTQAADSLHTVSTTAFWFKPAPDAPFQLQSNINAHAFKHAYKQCKHAYKHKYNDILCGDSRHINNRFGIGQSAASRDAFAKHVKPGSGADAVTTNH